MKKTFLILLVLGWSVSSCAAKKEELKVEMKVEKMDGTTSECRRSCTERHSKCLTQKNSQNKTKLDGKKLSPDEMKVQLEKIYRVAKEIERTCKKERSRCLALCID